MAGYHISNYSGRRCQYSRVHKVIFILFFYISSESSEFKKLTIEVYP